MSISATKDVTIDMETVMVAVKITEETEAEMADVMAVKNMEETAVVIVEEIAEGTVVENHLEIEVETVHVVQVLQIRTWILSLWIFGKIDNVHLGILIDILAGHSGLNKKQIGNIDIQKRHCLVEIDKKFSKKMDEGKILKYRGRKITIKKEGFNSNE